MLDIITDHEAAQREACRRPLYNVQPECTGSCSQGRTECMTPEACLRAEEEFVREPMTRKDAYLAVVLVLAAWGAVAVLSVPVLALLNLVAGWL